MISSKTLAIVAVTLLPAPAAGAFDVVGHRGARGLAPENTLGAFMTGARVGATSVEGDVMITEDHHVIVRHDPRAVPGLCSGGYHWRYWKNLTFAQVRRLDCGQGAHVPTLGQVYRAVPARVRVLVEAKHDPYHARRTFGREKIAHAIVATIRTAGGVKRTTVQSFDWGVLREIGRLEPRLRLQVLASKSTFHRGSRWLAGVHIGTHPFPYGLAGAARRAGFDAIAAPASALTPALLASAHAQHLTVTAYTIDSPERMADLIARGADGIVTDYPDRLRALVSP